MGKRILNIKIFFVFIGILVACCEGKNNIKLIAGGYTDGNQPGIFIFDFNTEEGNLELLTEADAGPNPSYFCFSEKHDLIYCLNEVMEFRGDPGGGLTVLKYDDSSSRYEKAGELIIPYGGPCFVSGSSDGRYLFLANYGSASVAIVRLDESGIPEIVTDSIMFETDSAKVSHPHMILQDPKGKYVYVTDLGLDHIMIYNFDINTGKLSQHGVTDVPEGYGPRHFAFNTSGSIMYLINELGSTMMVFKVDEQGGLGLLQTLSTLAEDFNGKSYCADVHVSNDARFLYGSNRGENSIVVFNINDDGTLSLAGRSSCGGNWPRNFVIDNSGNYLLVANQRSDQISVFNINEETGRPEGPIDEVVMKTPACLKFMN